MVAGAASFWIIQDFPDQAKFLSEQEREDRSGSGSGTELIAGAFVVRRLQSDDQFSAAGEKLRAK